MYCFYIVTFNIFGNQKFLLFASIDKGKYFDHITNNFKSKTLIKLQIIISIL